MYRDGDAIRLIGREAVLLLGGGRALLMQLAHPSVAAGVAQYSSFERDGLDRLRRTLEATYAIVFGSPRQAEAVGARLRAVHERVRGPGYRASDPELLLWVHATLVDTALLTYSRFLRPLRRCEEERYYADSKRMAELLGVPSRMLPPDLEAFRRYTATMVGALRVSATARRLAAAVFRPLPGLGPLPLLARELTAGLLPGPLRDQYGLPWDERRAASLRVASSLSRAVLPRLPLALRAVPPFLLPPPDHGEPPSPASSTEWP